MASVNTSQLIIQHRKSQFCLDPAPLPQRWIRNIWRILVNLNFYKSLRKMEAADLEHQRCSTRLYMTLLTLSVFVLTVYSSLIVETKTIQIKNASLSVLEELQMRTSSLQCPCTILSIPYEHLFQIEPHYHHVCSSEFITSKWIEGLNKITNFSPIELSSFYNPLGDFRTTGPAIFQVLRSMCELANDTVGNALSQFGKTQFVSAQFLKSDLFLKQINLTIQQFQSSLPNNSLSLWQLTRNLTYMNQFISGSLDNVDFYFRSSITDPQTIATFFVRNYYIIDSNGLWKGVCSCANDINCGQDATIYPVAFSPDFYTLPNFKIRCFPVESLIQSTLECFYNNHTCLDIIANKLNQTLFINITRLNAFQPSRFSINSPVGDLLEQLFIESWSSNLSYQSYFIKCQPVLCSYEVSERRSLLEIVTTIAGLTGGLSTIFKLLSPYIVSTCVYFLRRGWRLRRNSISQQGTNLSTKIIVLVKKLRDILINLNIFEDVTKPVPSEDEKHVQRQSTRIYILLLSLALAIIATYTSLTYQNNNYQVEIFSLDVLQNLQEQYGSTVVKCPCTQLSFAHSTYLQVKPVFHELCSSDFISTSWLNTLFGAYKNEYLFSPGELTAVQTTFAHFQAMLILCDFAKKAVSDARDMFLNTSVVSAQMPDFNLFDKRTNSTLVDFQSTLPENLLHTFQMFRGLVQSNGFISGYITNWNLITRNITGHSFLYVKPQWHGRCSCATSTACVKLTRDFLPGLVVGCLPLESFLRSTLECFYDQLCADKMASYFYASDNLTALNNTDSRFHSNVSGNTLLEQMFIESWSSNVSYEKFFQQCQPTSCSYILIEKYNILFVGTTATGLYGGLTILLKLVVPFVMNQLYKLVRKFRRNNSQVAPINDCD